jgi:hypothetical protein
VVECAGLDSRCINPCNLVSCGFIATIAANSAVISATGGVAERFKALVLKTSEGLYLP